MGLDTLHNRDERLNRKIASKRQIIISGRHGQTYSDFIEQETSTTAKIIASADEPLILSLSDGQQEYKRIFTTNFTGVSLTTNATNFIGYELDNTTLITTLIPPYYGVVRTSDRENKIAASFNGTNGDTSFTDLYGNVFNLIGGPTISNGHTLFSNNNLRVNGAGYVVCNTPPNTTSLDSWTLEFNYRFDAGGTSEQLMIVSSDFQLAIDKNTSDILRLYMGDGSSWSIINAQAVTPALSAATWYHLELVFENANSWKFYVDGVLRYVGVTTVFTKISLFNKIYFGAKADGSNPSTANFANIGFWPYVKHSNKTLTTGTTVFTAPSAAITADTPNYFRYTIPDSVMLATFDDANFDDLTWFQDSYGRYIMLSQDGGANKAAYIKNDAVNSKWGGRVLRLDGASYAFAQMEDIVPAHKWTMRVWTKADNYTAAGYLFVGGDATTFNFKILHNATNGRLALYLSSNGSSFDIANGVLSTTTSFAAATYYHIEVTYDGSNYRVFVNGNIEITVASQLSINWPSNFKLGSDAGGAYLIGYFNDWQFLPYATHVANFSVPVASPTPDNLYAFDNKDFIMYKGLPPTTFTAQPTIFLGEVEMLATMPETIISYSLNGMCGPIEFSGVANEDLASTTNFRHNIGTKQIKIKTSYKILNSQFGFRINDMIETIFSYDASDFSYKSETILDRNLFSHTTGAGGYTLLKKTTGAALAINNTTDGNILFNIERVW